MGGLLVLKTAQCLFLDNVFDSLEINDNFVNYLMLSLDVLFCRFVKVWVMKNFIELTSGIKEAYKDWRELLIISDGHIFQKLRVSLE